MLNLIHQPQAEPSVEVTGSKVERGSTLAIERGKLLRTERVELNRDAQMEASREGSQRMNIGKFSVESAAPKLPRFSLY